MRPLGSAKIRRVLLGTLLLGKLVVVGASPSSLAVAVSMTSQGDRDLVSISARAAPLANVLMTAARHAGIEVVGTPVARLVSIELRPLPLDQAFRGLLQGESFIFVYDGPLQRRAAQLARIILLASSTASPGAASSENALEPPSTADSPPVPENPVTPQGAETFDPDAPLGVLLPLINHPDPRMRTAALEALSLHDGNDLARRALMSRIHDPAPSVRAVVLGVLGPFITQWPGASEVAMRALHDPAVEVRGLALRVLSEAHSPDTPHAIDIALQDEDAAIRALANELQRAEPDERSSE